MKGKRFAPELKMRENGVVTIGTLYEGPYQSFITYLPVKEELVFNNSNSGNAGTWVDRMSAAEAAEKHAGELWYKSFQQAVLLGKGWKTLEWKRLDAGEYESADGRFYVLQTWDRLYGKHWCLQDRNVEDYYKSQTACDSLKHAKHVAELTINRENGVYEKPPIHLTDDML